MIHFNGYPYLGRRAKSKYVQFATIKYTFLLSGIIFKKSTGRAGTLLLPLY